MLLVDVDECLCTNQDKWRLNYPQLTKTLMKEEEDLEGKKHIFIFIQLSLCGSSATQGKLWL